MTATSTTADLRSVTFEVCPISTFQLPILYSLFYDGRTTAVYPYTSEDYISSVYTNEILETFSSMYLKLDSADLM